LGCRLIALAASAFQTDVFQGRVCPECIDQLASIEGPCAAGTPKGDAFIFAKVGDIDLHDSLRLHDPGLAMRTNEEHPDWFRPWRTRGIGRFLNGDPQHGAHR
jgi:hypothetical protein